MKAIVSHLLLFLDTTQIQLVALPVLCGSGQMDENPELEYANRLWEFILFQFDLCAAQDYNNIIIIEDSPVKNIAFQLLFILGTTHSTTSGFVSSALKVDMPGCEPESVTCLWIMRNSHFPIRSCLPRDYNGAQQFILPDIVYEGNTLKPLYIFVFSLSWHSSLMKHNYVEFEVVLSSSR